MEFQFVALDTTSGLAPPVQVLGGSVSQVRIGVAIEEGTPNLENVLIKDFAVTDATLYGMLFRSLNHSVLENVTIRNSGNFAAPGAHNSFGIYVYNNSGNAMQGNVFRNVTIVNSGVNEDFLSNPNFPNNPGAAVLIEGRNQDMLIIDSCFQSQAGLLAWHGPPSITVQDSSLNGSVDAFRQSTGGPNDNPVEFINTDRNSGGDAQTCATSG